MLVGVRNQDVFELDSGEITLPFLSCSSAAFSISFLFFSLSSLPLSTSISTCFFCETPSNLFLLEGGITEEQFKNLWNQREKQLTVHDVRDWDLSSMHGGTVGCFVRYHPPSLAAEYHPATCPPHSRCRVCLHSSSFLTLVKEREELCGMRWKKQRGSFSSFHVSPAISVSCLRRIRKSKHAANLLDQTQLDCCWPKWYWVISLPVYCSLGVTFSYKQNVKSS